MTRLLYRLSRTACPASDRPWLDALFAEVEAVETGRGRLLWLAGALGLLADRRARRIAAMATPAWLACLTATITFAVLAFMEYEGLAIEDDWYPVIAALSVAALLAVSVSNLRRPRPEAWP